MAQANGCSYPNNSTSRKKKATSSSSSSKATQNPYGDFGKGHEKSPGESNYSGNKVSGSGSYKSESAKVTKSPKYS